MKSLMLGALCGAFFMSAQAVTLAPADVQLKTDPGVTVRVTPRAGNTSKNVDITVNKQDRVFRNGAQVYPVPPPPPPPPAACAAKALSWAGASTSTATPGCSSTYPGGASGSSIVLTDGTEPDTGTANATCTNGIVTVSAQTCVTTPPMNMHGGNKIDESTIPVGHVRGLSAPLVRLTNEVDPPDVMGDFRTVCDFSHAAYNDPIVFPGQPGKSHLHVFFGNTLTDANSTYDTLIASGNSTCRGGIINRSGYWVPAMFDTVTGAFIRPVQILVYYKTGSQGVKPADVKPFPHGFRMIAGDPSATGPQNPSAPKSGFSCDGNGHYNSIQAAMADPACGAGHTLWAGVLFPQCWDGVNLDSPDHKSHMAYGQYGVGCPASHPVPLAEVAFNVHYLIPAGGMGTWRLASDMYDKSLPGGYSYHGDYFPAWNDAYMKRWVEKCDNLSHNCDAHRLGQGLRMDYCAAGPDGLSGCANPPIELTTTNGWTKADNGSGFTFLDVDRVIRFGPNADGGYVTMQGKAGTNYCNAQAFGWPPAAPGVPRTCEIAAPNPISNP